MLLLVMVHSSTIALWIVCDGSKVCDLWRMDGAVETTLLNTNTLVFNYLLDLVDDRTNPLLMGGIFTSQWVPFNVLT